MARPSFVFAPNPPCRALVCPEIMGVEMPDIGGLGRGLLKGALSATEKVKDAAVSRKVSVDEPVRSEPAPEPPAEEPEQADASDVRELVEMFQQLLAKRRPPEGPIPGDWSVGIGDLLAEHPSPSASAVSSASSTTSVVSPTRRGR